MMTFRKLEDLDLGADEPVYQAWKKELVNVYHQLGFEEAGVIGDVLFVHDIDRYLGRGYNLRMLWKKGKEPE